MVKLNTLVKFLNKELKIKSIKDKYCNNGLQVRGRNNVTKIGLSTDACLKVFKKAEKIGCDMIITHHGLFSKINNKYANNVSNSKALFLKKIKISLYCCHLPLDKHKKYGNNAILFKILDAKPIKIFAEVGYLGYLNKPMNIDSIVKILKKNLKTECKVYKFGKIKNIKRVAILSGYGGGDVEEAIIKKVDLYITGEISHGTFVNINDEGLSVIEAGHYNTETLGVKEVGKILEKKFGVKTVFIDSPTGM